MRLLGEFFKKTAEKPTANTYATERKRLNSESERTFGPFMHGFHMIGFQRKGALFVLYPRARLAARNSSERASFSNELVHFRNFFNRLLSKLMLRKN